MPYAPAGNLTTSAGLTHLATVWYQRKALDQLKQMFRFLNITEPDILPLRSGKTVQFYRYDLPTANTQASSEGTVGVSLNPTTATITATVSEYSDFVSTSTFLEETAIDPIVQNFSEWLGYRGGLSVDTIVRNEFDTNTAANISTLGAAATVADLRRTKALLASNNVMPLKGDEFMAIIHPFISYDIQSDNTAGGFIDISKYAATQQLLSGELGKAGGVRMVESTNVTTSGTAPNVLYNTYIEGKGGVGVVDLAGSGPSKVENPTRQAFNVRVIRGGPSPADPEGMIGSYVSYRFVFVTVTLDTTTLRFRIVQADASLV